MGYRARYNKKMAGAGPDSAVSTGLDS